MKEHWIVKAKKVLAKLTPLWQSVKTSYQDDKRVFIEYSISTSISIIFCSWIMLFVVLPFPIIPRQTHILSFLQTMDLVKPLFLHAFAFAGAGVMIIPLARVWAAQLHLLDSLPISAFKHMKRIQKSKISK